MHCHGDFAQIFDEKTFANMKLLLEHRKENTKGILQGRTNYKQFLAASLKYTGRTWKKLANFFKLQSISILAICSQI